MADGKIVSVVDSPVSSINESSEQRPFDINKARALVKKLRATSKEAVTRQDTGGGIRLMFNAGMYELFKYSAETFYDSGKLPFSCNKKPVCDRQGNIIETKYKLTSGRQCVYTLNMYHTTSSCLINGKQTDQFTDFHFHKMVQLIQDKMSRSNTSVSEINDVIRDLVSSVISSSSDDSTETSPKEVFDPILTLSENTDDIESTHCDESTHPSSPIKAHTESAHDGSAVTTLSEGNREMPNPATCKCLSHVTNFLDQLRADINDLRAEIRDIRDHVTQNTSQTHDIKNNIQSLKSQNKVTSEHINSDITEVKDNLQNLSINLLRKLQSVADSLRSQTHKPTQRNCSPVPVHQSPIVNDSPTVVLSEETTHEPNNRRNQPTTHSCVVQQQQAKQLQSGNGTLLIGDSILKGIQTRGLDSNVNVKTCPGASVNDIKARLENIDLSTYKTIIIYVGGNDSSSNIPSETIYKNLKATVGPLTKRANVYLCTVCPRRDTDVVPVNDIIKQLCEETSGLDIIDCYQTFIFGDGRPVFMLYGSDGVHLSPNGSRSLVSSINRVVNIIKKRQQSDRSPQLTRMPGGGYRRQPRDVWGRQRGAFRGRWQQSRCGNCGLTNHSTRGCRRPSRAW